eukprot:41736-Eustigmatos_ZCMA.PRE.1
MLLLGGLQVIMAMMRLFTEIVLTRAVPAAWKVAQIIPLFKGGGRKRSDWNNHRGIALVSIVMK